MKKPKSVDDYISESLYPEILIKLRAVILATGLVETIKWMFPVYTLNNKNVVGLGSFKAYAGIWFFQGVFLKDEAKVLVNAQEGKTKAMRQWRLNSHQDLDEGLLKAYLYEAIQNTKDGLEVKIIKTKKVDIVIPEILQNAFNKNLILQKQFDSLPKYKQRAYIEHIGSAKQESTKIRRLEKSVTLILNRKGLSDQYR